MDEQIKFPNQNMAQSFVQSVIATRKIDSRYKDITINSRGSEVNITWASANFMAKLKR